MRNALDDIRYSYTIGFSPTGDARPGFHKVRVQVSRPGVKLRHPEGYNLDELAESGAQNHENTTAQALTSPLDFTAIPITVKADRAGDTLTMQMSLDVGSLDLVSENDRWTGKLEMAARFATADGKQAGFIISQIAEYNMLPQTYNAAVRDGLNLQITLQIPRNATVLRQLVRNVKSGKVGTLSIPLATESAK